MARPNHKRFKNRRRKRDLDLIYDDLSTKESVQRLKNQPVDETKPGLGQYYCVECAKYFETQPTLDHHTKSKVHKRRVRALKIRPYTTLEAEAAAGVNLKKFMELVEKYKQIEAYKQDHKEELDAIKNEKKDTLDAIITGVPSEAADADAMTD